jgi:hypothetical protein
MKLFGHTMLALSLILAFVGASFAMSSGMMTNSSSVCSTHCVTFSGAPMALLTLPANRDFLALFALAVATFVGFYLALPILSRVYIKRARPIRLPIGLYHLNMTYMGYLG